MDGFVDVAGVGEIACDTGRSVIVGAVAVALFNVGGRWFAVEDTCLRCGASLAAGSRTGAEVRCRCGWRYELATGRLTDMPSLCVETYQVKIVDARVLVAGA